MKLSTITAVFGQNVKIWAMKAVGRQDDLKPYKVLVSLTNQCNSRCEYCDIWQINPNNPELYQKEIAFEDLVAMFEDLGPHLIWLALTGGEITLVRYFKDMVRVAKEKCPNLRLITFTTNALAPGRAVEYATYIRNQGLDAFVTISLDGDKAMHDKVRGVPGNYDKCMKLYDALKREKIPVYYGITVADENVDFIEAEYASRANELKSVTFVHSGGIYEKDNEVNYNRITEGLLHIYRNYRISHLSEWLEKIHIKVSLLFLRDPFSRNVIPCEVMNTTAHILPYGEIQPCMFMPSFGNIKTDKLTEVYAGEKAREMRRAIAADDCPKCWMNCYSPFSIMQHPFKSIAQLFRR